MPGPEAPSVPPHALTAEEWARWKAEQAAQRELQQEASRVQRAADLASGRVPVDEMTGKELHQYHPELFENY
jgi:hypothetical protein